MHTRPSPGLGYFLADMDMLVMSDGWKTSCCWDIEEYEVVTSFPQMCRIKSGLLSNNNESKLYKWMMRVSSKPKKK